MYILYLINHFDMKYMKIIAFSQFKSELEGWLEVNWIQYRDGIVPVIEHEVYFKDRIGH